MPWQIAFHADLGIVETRFVGNVGRYDLEAAARETLAEASAKGCTRVLGDCRELTGGHSLADLFFLADALKHHQGPRPLREAVVLPVLPSAQSLAKFWEDTANNRGLIVELFNEREAAIEWLKHQPTPLP